MQIDIFGDVKPASTSLVYRKSHKSELNKVLYPEPSKVYDFKNFISIRPTSICEYQRNIIPDLSIRTIENNSMPIDRRHHGIVSTKGNKNIQSIIDWMVLLAKEKETINPKDNSHYSFKLNFTTLTLPAKQKHSDKFLTKNLLMPFLDWIRKTPMPEGLQMQKTFMCKHYFYRSESQSNGNIHWHLCCDVFIPWLMIRTEWNKLLGKLGYIDTFEKKHNHRHPNSIDIHSIKKIKNIARYLSKYCGKNAKGITVLLTKKKTCEQKLPVNLLSFKWSFPQKNARFFRQIYSRLWSCSQKLSKLKSCKVQVTPFIQDELDFFRANFIDSYFPSKYCTVYKVDCQNFVDLEMIMIRRVLAIHVREILFGSS